MIKVAGGIGVVIRDLRKWDAGASESEKKKKEQAEAREGRIEDVEWPTLKKEDGSTTKEHRLPLQRRGKRLSGRDNPKDPFQTCNFRNENTLWLL